MTSLNRRTFLKTSGLTVLPALHILEPAPATSDNNRKGLLPGVPIIKFYGDGEIYEPGDYIHELQKAHAAASIVKDRYGVGGVVEALENKFAAITGKEKAVYMPSGTMANQLAIAVLSGENTKVFVQDTSHVYRDEADAAQSVFQKRLMPLAPGATFFTAQQLQQAVENLNNDEVFKSGIGAVSVENPVRRTDGKMVPLEEIRKISTYCRSNNIRLHLDGARIFIASGWTGVSVKEYASYFDTIYISLYKYLGASGGAMLCGPKEVMDKMNHLIKVHGGSMFGNWTNAAMALYRLEGFERRLQSAIKASGEIFKALNKLPGVQINSLDGGTNIYEMNLSKEINGKRMQETLSKEFNIRMAPPDDGNHARIMVNETLLYQSPDYVINAFKKSM
jgi:threonine aldolase